MLQVLGNKRVPFPRYTICTYIVDRYSHTPSGYYPKMVALDAQPIGTIGHFNLKVTIKIILSRLAVAGFQY